MSSSDNHTLSADLFLAEENRRLAETEAKQAAERHEAAAQKLEEQLRVGRGRCLMLGRCEMEIGQIVEH